MNFKHYYATTYVNTVHTLSPELADWSSRLEGQDKGFMMKHINNPHAGVAHNPPPHHHPAAPHTRPTVQHKIVFSCFNPLDPNNQLINHISWLKWVCSSRENTNTGRAGRTPGPGLGIASLELIMSNRTKV